MEFGPNRSFVGILAQPDKASPVADLAVLIVNAGIIHRVGPNRLHVRMARTLARNGYACLRYDLPGIGDSEMPRAASMLAANVAATREAVDTLIKRSVARRFVIMGLCSGADHAFLLMSMDARLDGAIAIDPTVMFSTPLHRINMRLKPLRRALRPRALWRAATGRYSFRQALPSETPAGALTGNPRAFSRESHPEQWGQTRSMLEDLIARDARVLVLTTGHNKDVCSYGRQMYDAFPDLPLLEQVLTLERRPRAEHTFDAEIDRRFLENRVVEWLQHALPESARVDVANES